MKTALRCRKCQGIVVNGYDVGVRSTINRHGSAWWVTHSENGAVNRTSWFKSSSRATQEQG